MDGIDSADAFIWVLSTQKLIYHNKLNLEKIVLFHFDKCLSWLVDAVIKISSHRVLLLGKHISFKFTSGVC